MTTEPVTEPPDLSLRAIAIGAGVVAVIAVVFVMVAGPPKLIARPGEDHTFVEPSDMNVRRVYQAAEKGDHQAMLTLASVYMDGHGVVMPDPAIAVMWLKRAADDGDASAMNSLGLLYLTGRGIGRDEAVALRWFQEGADKGQPAAMLNLGVCYAMGRGAAADRAKAAQWLRQAAAGSDAQVRQSALELLRKLGV